MEKESLQKDSEIILISLYFLAWLDSFISL